MAIDDSVGAQFYIKSTCAVLIENHDFNLRLQTNLV